MGISISDGADSWTVTPKPLHGPAKVDVGNAGTVMRFLPPLAALAHGEIAFDGDPRSYERPLGPVIKALEELGIEIEHEGRYSLPMVIKAKWGATKDGKLTAAETTLLADGDDRADEMLVHAHASGDAVHDDADALLLHAAAFRIAGYFFFASPSCSMILRSRSNCARA